MSEEEGQEWRAPGGQPSPSQPPRQDTTPEPGPDGGNHTSAPAPGQGPAGPQEPGAPEAAPADPVGAPGRAAPAPSPWAAPDASAPAAVPQGWPPPPGSPAPPGPGGGPASTAAGTDGAAAAALRPATLSDLLNGGFAYLRDNPRTAFGLSFLVVALTSVLPALGMADMFSGYTELLRSEVADPAALGMSGLGTASFYVGTLLQSVASVLLLGLLSTVVAAAALGRRMSLREAVAALRGRWGSLFTLVGFYLAFSSVAVGALTVVLLFAVLLTVVVPLVGLPLFLLLLAGYVALFGWLAVKTSLAVPVAVLERASAGQALVRSWQLSTNNFWRMAGALVLAFLLSSVIANVLSLPFSLGALLTGLAEELPLATLLTVVLSFLGMLVTGCVSEPFIAGVTTLLYLDVRVRREALDLRLREAVRTGATPGPEFLAATSPGGAAA